MTRFLNGTAAGLALTLTRAPMFLRVVHSGAAGRDPKTGKLMGEWDALDQLDDTPKPNEQLYTYMIKGNPSICHVDGRDPKTGKRFGRTCVVAEYMLFEPQPSDEIMRDNDKWGEWTTATGTEMLKVRPRRGG